MGVNPTVGFVVVLNKFWTKKIFVSIWKNKSCLRLFKTIPSPRCKWSCGAGGGSTPLSVFLEYIINNNIHSLTNVHLSLFKVSFISLLVDHFTQKHVQTWKAFHGLHKTTPLYNRLYKGLVKILGTQVCL